MENFREDFDFAVGLKILAVRFSIAYNLYEYINANGKNIESLSHELHIIEPAYTVDQWRKQLMSIVDVGHELDYGTLAYLQDLIETVLYDPFQLNYAVISKSSALYYQEIWRVKRAC